MTKMRKVLMSSLLGVAALLTACSQDENGEMPKAATGSIRLGVSAQAAFTRAVNENEYTNTDNYTVQILQGEQVKEEFKYADGKENSYELPNGTYTLRAFYNQEYKDVAASRNGFYVEGEQNFQIQGTETTATVTCEPTCGKLVTKWDAEMGTYFSDYSVTYETAALKAESKTATWTSTDTEPWYVKLPQEGEDVKATITVTRKSDNKTAEPMVKTYTLKPNKSWTLSIAPVVNNGNLGLSITINEATNDQEIDITVPSDWI